MILAARDSNGHLLRDDAPAALFPWWSFTKPVIATLVLRAAEQQLLDLDAPLPNWPFSLRQLLQHRAGLLDYGPLPAYQQAVAATEPPWPAARLLTTAQADQLAYPPGQGWQYSNIGYLLLRQQLERVYDCSLAEIMQQHILTPLGLTARLAQTTADFEDLHWDACGYHPGWVYHGCLMGRAADATLLLHALLTGQLLTSDSLREMLIQQMRNGPIPGRVWCETGYGLGLMIGRAKTAGRVIGHSGCGPFSANLVAQFPDLPGQPTVAAFGSGGDETRPEFAAVETAISIAL